MPFKRPVLDHMHFAVLQINDLTAAVIPRHVIVNQLRATVAAGIREVVVDLIRIRSWLAGMSLMAGLSARFLPRLFSEAPVAIGGRLFSQSVR